MGGMTKSDASRQEENRQAFLRHLTNRIEAIEQRIHRYRREGWDVDGLMAIHDDVQRLTGASGRYDLIGPSQHLLMLEQILGEDIVQKTLPDPEQDERMLASVTAIAASLTTLPGDGHSAHAEITSETSSSGQAPGESKGGSMPRSIPAHGASLATTASGTIAPAASAWTSERYVYNLSDGNPFALEVGHSFTEQGYEVEDVETADDLFELLTNLTPHLLVVDCSRVDQLAAVGKGRRDAQERRHKKGDGFRVVAMAEHDSLQLRLDARRAGVDTLLFPPFNSADIVRRAQTLLTPEAEKMVRVLIVEDDPSQALFAQSVLVNAGIQARVELEPMHVLEALDALHPDMILMDLHMPDANGVELTALIREQPAFMRTPIVFLTGESDPDVRSEAISAGGDDYLTKPIRPKHLIAAVQNRVRRIRALEKRDLALTALDVATGLFRRPYVLNCINDALGASADHDQETGGALFLEIDGTAQLHDRFGIAALEQLMVAAGCVLADAIGERYVAAQVNHNAFLVLATELDDSALGVLAKALRDRLMQHAFEIGGSTLRLRISVGICPLRFGFDDAGALLNIADRTCRDARGSDEGIAFYRSIKAAEINLESARIAQLREAIDSDGFGLIYQPIVAVQGSGQAQYQTLLRLRDTSGRQLPAAEILPVAERAGLMIEIDRWVLTRAMNVLCHQLDRGSPVRLFVPQAMSTIVAGDQRMFLTAEMAARELPGSALVLECRLEDALLNTPALRAFASAMHEDGIQMCLGHYTHSTEASRLLDEIPLGFIKLAPQYVAASASRELRDEARMAINSAHRIGIQVIGHGIEDAQMAATMWMSGIDYIQGYLVQSPRDELDFDFNAAVL
jgi:diguanylate cyclase (GGDEF)-like protein